MVYVYEKKQRTNQKCNSGTSNAIEQFISYNSSQCTQGNEDFERSVIPPTFLIQLRLGRSKGKRMLNLYYGSIFIGEVQSFDKSVMS